MGYYYVNHDARPRHERRLTGITARQQRLRRQRTLLKPQILTRRYNRLVDELAGAECGFFVKINRSDRRFITRYTGCDAATRQSGCDDGRA